MIKSNEGKWRRAGADCAVLAGNGDCAGILSGQASAFGMDARTAARAYLAATNHVIACCANSAASGLFDACANMTLMVPEKLREIKLRAMIETAAVQAEETGIPDFGLQCAGASLMVTEAVAVRVISAGMENRSESNLVPVKKQSLADRHLVMTKWLGLEGTAVIAADSRGKLCGRYPSTLWIPRQILQVSVRRAGGCYRREVRRRLSL